MLDVHRAHQAETVRERSAIEGRIAELRWDASAPRTFIAGKLRESEHSDAIERNEAALSEAHLAVRDARATEDDTEAIVAFAERTLTDLAGLWRRLDPDARQRFQRALFPDGVPYDGRAFGTARTSSLFSGLRLISGAGAGGASLSTPSWNQVASWMRELEDLRRIVGEAA